LSKENHICHKRTTFVKRDLQNTFLHDLVLFVTHTDVNQLKRILHLSKETYICQKRPTFVTRDLHNTLTYNLVLFVKPTVRESTQKRPAFVKRDLHSSKETYNCQKRPTKHAHSFSKPICHTRGTENHQRGLHLSKETYKTDPHTN